MYTFYCTDQGRHKRRDIGRVQDGEQTNHNQDKAVELFAEFGFPDEKFTPMPARLVERRSRKRTNYQTGKVIESEFDGVTSTQTRKGRQWNFTCPTCKRSPRITDQQLKQLFDMATDQPTVALDISNWAQ